MDTVPAATSGSTNQQSTVASPLAQTPPEQSASTVVSSGSVNTGAPSSNIGVAELIDQYEKRHRALMSEKDKMANERDKAIAAQVELQKQLAELQEKSQTALTGAAQTTQSAIDHNKQLAQDIERLKAENIRYTVLAQNPELLDYAQFIPASSDAEVVKQAVEQLKQINQKQLARLNPQSTQQPPQTPGVLGLYTGQPGMAPLVNGVPLNALQQPGSNPSQMAPMSNPAESSEAINAMLQEAQQSGDQIKFQAALEEAKKLAELQIRAVMG